MRAQPVLVDALLFNGVFWLGHLIPLTGTLQGVVTPGFEILGWIVPLLCIWRWGMTPGKWLMRIRVTRSDGAGLSLGRSLLRMIIFLPGWLLLPPICLLIGTSQDDWAMRLMLVSALLWMLTLFLLPVSLFLISLPPRRQALHDRCADTIVVRLSRRPSGRIAEIIGRVALGDRSPTAPTDLDMPK